MASTRLRMNVGGRIFETSKTTLVNSGSAFFGALLGSTGEAFSEGLPSISSRKRLRTLNEEDDEEDDEEDTELREVFVDRDPDVFKDVLYFMRSMRLPALARSDPARLADLKCEAAFFGIGALEEACDGARRECKALVDGVEAEAKPQPSARSIRIHVPEGDESALVPFEPDEVIYVVSATLLCPFVRYKVEEETRSETVEGCYLDTCKFVGEDDAGELKEDWGSGDFQLCVDAEDQEGGDDSVVLAHVGLNIIHVGHRAPTNVDLRQDLGICLSQNPNDSGIRFSSKGHSGWDIVAWVGSAEAIPHLQPGKSGHQSKRAASAASLATGNGDLAATALAAALLAKTQQNAAALLSAYSFLHLADLV